MGFENFILKCTGHSQYCQCKLKMLIKKKVLACLLDECILTVEKLNDIPGLKLTCKHTEEYNPPPPLQASQQYVLGPCISCQSRQLLRWMMDDSS
jgi:hypothetical protein